MRVEARTALLLVTVVLLASCWTEAKDCSVVKCMLKLFTCNRINVSQVGKGSEIDCCPRYIRCVLDCEPDAQPKCNRKGKRGSWNKRERLFNPFEEDSMYEPY